MGIGFQRGLTAGRALGACSNLGDPSNPTMQETLNLRIKYRESFRPFAPAVLEAGLAEAETHPRFRAPLRPDRVHDERTAASD